MTTGRIVLVYLLFGLLWISLSDLIIEEFTAADRNTTILQTAKGAFFVASSSALIYGLLRYHEAQLAESKKRAETVSQESQVLQRILRHNIRNDLNVITGYIDMATEDVHDQESVRELARARKKAEDLLQMSEKVRVIEGVELDDSVPEPVDAVAVIEDLLGDVRQRRPDLRIETELPEEQTVSAGPSLRYALDELIENAIQHTDTPVSDQRIGVSIRDLGEAVRIAVSDSGPGIPEAEVRAILAGEETQLDHGSGLGLWLVRWVCDLYGGDLAFESDDRAGTTVSITLQKPPVRDAPDGVVSGTRLFAVPAFP